MEHPMPLQSPVDLAALNETLSLNSGEPATAPAIFAEGLEGHTATMGSTVGSIRSSSL